jgi:uncharacterized protein
MPDPRRPIPARSVRHAGVRGLLVLSLLLAGGLRAQTVPALTGRVVDTADILSPTTEAALTARLAALEDSSTAQVAVLTIPSLGGEVLEEYATEVFRAWGLGQADRDNGVLLLVAHADRQLRIEVGYGLEGDLTDARAGAIIRDEIVPRFRDGDFDAGVIAGVEAIVGSIEGTYQEPVPEPMPWWFWALFGVTFGSLPFVPLLIALRTGPASRFRPVLAALLALLPGAVLSVPLVATLDSAVGLLPLALVPLLAIGADVWLERHPRFGPARRARRKRNAAIRAARRRGASSVVVDGVRYTVPSYSSSGGGSSGSSFSGGGGSSGGGGASGGW